MTGKKVYGKKCINFDDGAKLVITPKAHKMLEGFNIAQIANNIKLTMDILHISLAFIKIRGGWLTVQYVIPKWYLPLQKPSTY